MGGGPAKSCFSEGVLLLSELGFATHLVMCCDGSRKLVLRDTFNLPPFVGPTTNQHHGKEGYEEGSCRGPSPQEGHESDEGQEGISD